MSDRCACRKSDSAILMMKATKDRLGCDGPDALNRPMERGVLVQRAMNARFIIISDKLVQDPAQVRLPEHDHVVETFRRIVPISLSTYGFCHGDRGAIGLSRMPLGQKIEAVEGIVPVWRSLVGRCVAIGTSRTSPFWFLAVANYTRKTRRSLR